MSPSRAKEDTLAGLDPNTSVDLLRLPTRARNGLVSAGYTTIGAVASLTDAEMLRLSNIGRYYVRLIKEALAGFTPLSTDGDHYRAINAALDELVHAVWLGRQSGLSIYIKALLEDGESVAETVEGALADWDEITLFVDRKITKETP